MSRVHGPDDFLVVAAIALAALTLSARAHGHDLPRTEGATFHADDPNLIAVFTSAGLLLSTDGGTKFALVCSAKIGLFAFETPALVYTTDAHLLVGGRTGLQRGSADGCDWQDPAPQLAAIHVADLIADPHDFGSSFAVTAAAADGAADEDQTSQLLHSRDDGRTWRALHAFGPEVVLQQVRVWPGTPPQIYLTMARDAADTGATEYLLSRSRDGGATWTEQVIPLEADDRAFELLYLSPSHPDRLLAMTVSHSQTLPGAHRILRSEDGGASWQDVMRLGALSGVAVDATTGRLWLADLLGELHRSDDEGATFEVVETQLTIGCLAHAHGRLWACADEWLDGFALGYSEDGGAHFTGLLRWQDVQNLVQCDPGHAIEPICGLDWQHLQQDLLDARRAIEDRDAAATDAGNAPGDLDAGTGGAADAGSEVEPGPAAHGGCDCRVGTRSAEHMPARASIVMSLLALLGCRRRRKPAR